MKKIIFALVFGLSAQLVMAQPSEKYMAAMQKNLQAMEDAFKNPASLLALANNFERIAEAEKTQWLPYYYAAFCQVNYGFMEADKSKTDMLANKATELINKADVLNPNNSEISCIRSMIASCHMMVDPMQRYMQYGAESEKQLAAAKQQDPTNPRPELLVGQGLKYTPEQFGGGCKTATVQLEAAMKKFETFKPATPMHPDWGKEIAAGIIAECK
ncbi:MAG: hypothetical protein H7X88_11210 [Gloeobacteraceae cyanobacterium ES-bin-316]|nr:hypothetical protein [Ferruginibacter sp.]